MKNFEIFFFFLARGFFVCFRLKRTRRVESRAETKLSVVFSFPSGWNFFLLHKTKFFFFALFSHVETYARCRERTMLLLLATCEPTWVSLPAFNRPSVSSNGRSLTFLADSPAQPWSTFLFFFFWWFLQLARDFSYHSNHFLLTVTIIYWLGIERARI